MNPTKIATALFNAPDRAFTVCLWDGTRLVSRDGKTRGTLALRRPDVVSLLVPPLDEDRIADAFVHGDIDIEGDTIGILEAIAHWEGPRLGLSALAQCVPSLLRRGALKRAGVLDARIRGRRRSIARDGTAVRHHYDISNDFYRLFLDARMVYSCAVFPTGNEGIDEAQRLKNDLICRKLDVRKADRLLDVGCGWGALMLHAAREYGANCVGATVSHDQFFEARRKASQENTPVRVLDCDYRKLPDETFDKIASVGMMEHVGRECLDTYFSALARRLRPGGLLLNHAIADIAEGSRVIPWLKRRAGFVQRCIFPDSDLPPLQAVVAAGERHGLEVRDVESLREHYADTLACWLQNLESRFEEAVALIGSERARTWRLYLAGSAVAFRLGRIGVYQTLFAKSDEQGRVHGVPRWRASWYRPADTRPHDASRWVSESP